MIFVLMLLKINLMILKGNLSGEVSPNGFLILQKK
jgi:hypothetical protein